MLNYAPASVLTAPIVRSPSPSPTLSQFTPANPSPPSGIPAWAVNLSIIAAGVSIGILAFPYRKKAWGNLVVDAAGGIAGIGLVFLILDLSGFRPKL